MMQLVAAARIAAHKARLEDYERFYSAPPHSDVVGTKRDMATRSAEEGRSCYNAVKC